MTEHDKSSAVGWKRPGRLWRTTPQPETTEETAGEETAATKASLALSALCHRHCAGCRVSLYGLGEANRGANQTSPPAMRLVNQPTDPAKSAGARRNRAGNGRLSSRPPRLPEANSKQEELANSWATCSRKSPRFPVTDAKTRAALAGPTSCVKLAGRKLWSDQGRHHCRRRAAESAGCEPADMNVTEPHYPARRAITEEYRESFRRFAGGLRRHYPSKVNQRRIRLITCSWRIITTTTPLDGFRRYRLSSSLSEWRINLQKSRWQNFMDSFHHHPAVAMKPLYRAGYAQNQDIICARTSVPCLLVAAQAARVIRKRPTNRRWITSQRGYAPITTPMMRRPPPSSKTLIKLEPAEHHHERAG